MLKLLISLFLFAAATSDLVSFASHFKIKLGKPCSDVNAAIEELNTIINNCNLFNVIEVIGCMKESASYLKENSLKIQKCLDRDSYYELGNLLNTLKENEYCIIFYTALHSNELFKLNGSGQIHNVIDFKEDIFSLLEESCSIHTYKFCKKIADFIVKSPRLTNFEIILESWVGFFNKIELDSKGDCEFQHLSAETNKKEKNNHASISKSFNFIIPIDEFWNEWYCALKNITSNSDFFNYFLRSSYENKKVSGKKNIDFYLKKFYTQKNNISFDCSKYTYDYYLIILRIMSLVLDNSEVILTENDIRWALGKTSNEKYENIFEMYYRSFKLFFKERYNVAKYYANIGYNAASDCLSKLADILDF